VAYAVPVAIAGLVAYDWFELPPTHPHAFPDATNLVDLLVHLTVAVMIGELAAHAVRRADTTEAARSELADEQLALRRVATLVTRHVPSAQTFAAVAREAGELLAADLTYMGRYEHSGEVSAVAAWSRAGDPLPVGRRTTVDGHNVTALVHRTGRPARIDSTDGVSGAILEAYRENGIRSTAGAPIVVDGRLWGVMIAGSKVSDRLPADTESRIAAFTELAATAISNTEAWAEVSELADEQAALRRVATLVAQGGPASDLFGAVAQEVGRLVGSDLSAMFRYDGDGTAAVLAHWSTGDTIWPVDTPVTAEVENVATLVLRTERATRTDDCGAGSGCHGKARSAGLRSVVGAPIIVDGRVWGAMIAASSHTERLPAGTESRIGEFTELLATAIANAEARSELQLLVEEQRALGRVATLVARGASQPLIFDAVASEASRLLAGESTALLRYEADGAATVVAIRGGLHWVGRRVPAEGDNLVAQVMGTGRAARHDSGATGTAVAGEIGVNAAVGAPIVVEGRLWGMLAAVGQDHRLPAHTEDRLAQFAELVAAAIGNAESRTQLTASRARIVAATDDERRRVVRDLHDGAQQRLVHTVVTLKLAHRVLERAGDASALVAEALEQAQRANVELRELAHGIIPAVLTRGGLPAGVAALASRMPVPVETSVSVGRLPAAVEATAYFVVAEALTNVAKHARAERAAVLARVEDDALRIDVRDDGIGGARPEGSGLTGLADRVAVLDGRLRVESPADGGTLVVAAIPLNGRGGGH
jgi:signal transduction histidine kinase